MIICMREPFGQLGNRPPRHWPRYLVRHFYYCRSHQFWRHLNEHIWPAHDYIQLLSDFIVQ
jgi:hypothetical protein